MIELPKLKVKETAVLKKFDAATEKLVEVLLINDGKIVERITDEIGLQKYSEPIKRELCRC
jgi:hypothetical protein